MLAQFLGFSHCCENFYFKIKLTCEQTVLKSKPYMR